MSCLPHQPRPITAALSMRLLRRRAGLLERVRSGERLVLPASVDDALHRRIRRDVALEIESADRIAGEADVGERDLIAMAVTAGLLRACQIGLQRLERRLVP